MVCKKHPFILSLCEYVDSSTKYQSTQDLMVILCSRWKEVLSRRNGKIINIHVRTIYISLVLLPMVVCTGVLMPAMSTTRHSKSRISATKLVILGLRSDFLSNRNWFPLGSMYVTAVRVDLRE
jgi:hypothetical protein